MVMLLLQSLGCLVWWGFIIQHPFFLRNILYNILPQELFTRHDGFQWLEAQVVVTKGPKRAHNLEVPLRRQSLTAVGVAPDVPRRIANLAGAKIGKSEQIQNHFLKMLHAVQLWIWYFHMKSFLWMSSRGRGVHILFNYIDRAAQLHMGSWIYIYI